MTRDGRAQVIFQSGGGPTTTSSGRRPLHGRARRLLRDLAARVRSLAPRLHRAAQLLHRIIGAPDYDAYLAHLAVHHPTCVPMTRDEFVQSRLTDRYSRPGTRCC